MNVLETSCKNLMCPSALKSWERYTCMYDSKRWCFLLLLLYLFHLNQTLSTVCPTYCFKQTLPVRRKIKHFSLQLKQWLILYASLASLLITESISFTFKHVWHFVCHCIMIMSVSMYIVRMKQDSANEKEGFCQLVSATGCPQEWRLFIKIYRCLQIWRHFFFYYDVVVL